MRSWRGRRYRSSAPWRPTSRRNVPTCARSSSIPVMVEPMVPWHSRSRSPSAVGGAIRRSRPWHARWIWQSGASRSTTRSLRPIGPSAIVYLMRRELEHAEAAAMRSIAIAPNYADGYGLLALINNNLGRPEKAIEQINKGIELNPYYTWDYPYNLGRAYYTLGRYEEAIAALGEGPGAQRECCADQAVPDRQLRAGGPCGRCRVAGRRASDGQSGRDDLAHRQSNSDFRSGAQAGLPGGSSTSWVARVAWRVASSGGHPMSRSQRCGKRSDARVSGGRAWRAAG